MSSTVVLGARDARRHAARWTGGVYAQVCEDMRADRAPRYGRPAAVAGGLDAYMEHQALRAPQVPRGHAAGAEGLVLWRGMGALHGLRRVGGLAGLVGGTRVAPTSCYTAFSHDRTIAESFTTSNPGGGGGRGRGGVVLRLDVRDIARGTPWVWFATRPGEHVVEGAFDEDEVLLPPGVFVVKRVRRPPPRVLVRPPGMRRPLVRLGGGITYVDVAYVPDPRYLRRGQLPRPGPDGFPLAELLSGELQRVPNARYRNRVRARSNAVRARANAVRARANAVAAAAARRMATGTQSMATGTRR